MQNHPNSEYTDGFSQLSVAERKILRKEVVKVQKQRKTGGSSNLTGSNNGANLSNASNLD